MPPEYMASVSNMTDTTLAADQITALEGIHEFAVMRGAGAFARTCALARVDQALSRDCVQTALVANAQVIGLSCARARLSRWPACKLAAARGWRSVGVGS
jgi:hypothetical protein